MTTCQTIPGTPPTQAVPPSTASNPNLGWNAGARSIAEIDGDLYLEFDMPAVTGAACGLAAQRRGTDPAFIQFGMLFKGAGGVSVFAVIENGNQRTLDAIYAPGDVFRIERRRGAVIYKHNGAGVYLSANASTGSLVTVGCLYAAEDQIGVPA